MKKVIATILAAVIVFSCSATFAGTLSIHTLGPIQYVMDDDYVQGEKKTEYADRFYKSTETSYDQYYLTYDVRTDNDMDETYLKGFFTGLVNGYDETEYFAGGKSEITDLTLNGYPAQIFHFDAVISGNKYHWHQLYCVTDEYIIDISLLYLGEYSETYDNQFIKFLKTVSFDL